MSSSVVSTDSSILARNLDAIRRRWPTIAEQIENGDSGVGSSVLPIESASDLLAKVTPTGACTEPLLLAGGDLAVWAAVYQLPCKAPALLTHRPPLYFAARSVADLSALKSLDCAAMFSDPRVRLFVGQDAIAQCQRFQLDNPHIPAAQTSVTLDPALFSGECSADSLWSTHLTNYEAELTRLEEELKQWRSRLITATAPGSLRILGITSRYTTFLQHSMRDWLDGLRELGHETEMVIESFDHELANPMTLARTALQFRPDVIVMIDHYRAELRGLPANVPFVMWIQDNLNNIFCKTAGAAQGSLDFCLGFGKLAAQIEHGYPAERFLPVNLGVNTARFSAGGEEIDEAFRCDLSFVSHASKSAKQLLSDRLEKADLAARKVLLDVFEQMQAIYTVGDYIRHPLAIRQMVETSVQRFAGGAPAAAREAIETFFVQNINNAMFRHQSLEWAAKLGLNLHLWGRGWETHPRLKRFAKGVACNQSQLLQIYRGSIINFQIVPTGAVHQRLLDGLAANAFFLCRSIAGDSVDPIYQAIWQFCEKNRIGSNAQLLARKTEIAQSLAAYRELMGVDLERAAPDMFAHVSFAAECEFQRSAVNVWADFRQISFDSFASLEQRVQTFLNDASARQQIVGSMRQTVLERFSYRAISQRLLELVTSNVAPASLREAA